MTDKQKKQPRHKPLLTIGMPLYNEERFLRATLDSLLSQTFSDFEIVICDNNSSDKTSGICKDYARKDKRIRYYKNKENIGEIKNFRKVFKLSQGKYFMWAAGHDLWESTFLTKCVKILEKDPSVVACLSFDKHIGPEGEIIKINDTKLDTRGNSRMVRFIKSMWVLHDTAIFKLMRANSLRKTRLHQYIQGPDHVVRVELSLLGSFAQIREPLFSIRVHKQENPQEALRRRLRSWSEFEKLPWLHMNLPHWATVYEYVIGACRLLPHWWQKIFYGAVAVFVGSTRYAKAMTGDVIKLAFPPFRK